MFVQVTKAYTPQYPDPICFDAGAILHVEREDPEFPGWFWCRLPSGKSGWVHRTFLAACTGTTTSVQAYSAKELTVAGGERGTVVRSLDGWAYIRLDTGPEGWIPQSYVHPTPSQTMQPTA